MTLHEGVERFSPVRVPASSVKRQSSSVNRQASITLPSFPFTLRPNLTHHTDTPTRTPTLSAPQRTGSPSSPMAKHAVGNGKGETGASARHHSHSLGSLSAGISMTASSAFRGLAAGVGVGVGGSGSGAGSGGGSGSTTNSEVGLGAGRAARELPRIRKGERIEECSTSRLRDWDVSLFMAHPRRWCLLSLEN